jgi:transcription elongation factor Elf1
LENNPLFEFWQRKEKRRYMQLLDLKCPSCGAVIDQRITSRIVTCQYCGSRFALEGDEAEAFIERGNDHPDEEERGSSSSMADYAAEVCKEFLESFDNGDRFKSSSKILDGLGVGGEDVYLIHDDTLFKSGKNGFAITENGLYVRDLGGKALFYDWATFAGLDEPEADNGYIKCDDDIICYFTCDNNVMPALQRLYRKLHKHAEKNA